MTSQLVYEWISGWERSRDDDDERQLIHNGHLDLFRNCQFLNASKVAAAWLRRHNRSLHAVPEASRPTRLRITTMLSASTPWT